MKTKLHYQVYNLLKKTGPKTINEIITILRTDRRSVERVLYDLMQESSVALKNSRKGPVFVVKKYRSR